jgi:gliding motility-associated-like protein
MKKKLLLFLLFHLLFGFTVSSKSLNDLLKLHNVNFKSSSKLVFVDTIKKNKKASRNFKTKAILSPPATTAGSSCGDGVSLIQVNVYAFGVNGSETIEWFTSQSSATPIYTGTVYSPSISSTKTYYVRSRFGSDISIRVPVVASIFVVPPIVTLTASPPNNTTSPLCLGTTVTFTASGGADLFEFSVDGVVMQRMSTSRAFTTNTLSDGQIVKVRTRYAVFLDGSITEMAWGTGVLEDNFLSAPLSVNASTGYVNSFKISALEDKVVLGIAGKVLLNRSILLFLDTKSGGFNVSNYGNEADNDPLVRAFNMFNNSPSTFDSYFLADYCLVITTDATETNYYANVIELKTGVSVKTYLGNASTGFPSSTMGVNKNNSGINDYSLGFEVEVLKSLIGYTTGDIKFFALTMNDREDGSQSVTNSFLSPERSSSLDYGIAAVDYNFKDPNPVVVASAALTPCYSEANITMNFVSIPTAASIIQPTCAVKTGTILISEQTGVDYSINGISYQDSNRFSGLMAGNYTLFVRNKLDNSCVLSSVAPSVINVIPTPPIAPTASSVIQPTCERPSGSIVITAQTGTEYSLNGTTYQVSNTFSTLAPGNYTMYVRNTADTTCVTSSGSAITINAIPIAPAVPTSAIVTQPTCPTPSGSIIIETQTGVAYSLNGTTYQASNSFEGLAPGTYTLFVRNTADNTCVTSSSSIIRIDVAPTAPVIPTAATITQPTCGVQSGSIVITAQTGVEYSLNGTTYQTSNTFTGLVPNNYILYVKSTADSSCVTPSGSSITINAIPTPPVIPTAASVVQPTCGTPLGSIVITTQTGTEYSLNETTYQVSNTFSGLAPGSYTIFVRNTADTTCITSSGSVITITAIPTPPAVPTSSSVTQPTCATPSGTIVINTQTGVTYSLNGTTYQASNSFAGLAPGTYTLFVRNTADPTCVTSASAVIRIDSVPTSPQVPTATTITQPTCGVQSGTIVLTTQVGVAYSLDGVNYQISNTFSGLVPNNYTLYVRNTADSSCVTLSESSITINAIPTPPVIPTAASVVQPTCGTPSGSIVIAAQPRVEYSLNGTTYQASNIFTGLAPNNYFLHVRNIADITCSVQSLAGVTVNPLPLLPLTPVQVRVVQPTCLVPSGGITISSQVDVQYSLGSSYQNSNVFTNLAPGKYIMNVRFTNSIACISQGSEITINAIPPVIQFETVGDCENKEYILTASPLLKSYDPNNVSYQWKDNLGNPIGTNSNVINVSDVIRSTPSGQVTFPVTYTLTITSTNTGCETSSNVVIESIYCNIQKGISPDGNGSNDFFDLRLMDVKKLEIFNRYGIKVFSQPNYIDQWGGQSDKGDDLPSATYYYVIEFNSGLPKTGWIYLIRENNK